MNNYCNKVTIVEVKINISDTFVVENLLEDERKRDLKGFSCRSWEIE